jgi:hypothetical protein
MNQFIANFRKVWGVKYSVAVFLLLFYLVPAVFASVLFSAIPLGKEKSFVSFSVSQSSNYSQQTDAKSNRYGLSVSYGLNDRLDAFLGIGSAKSVNLLVPATPLAADNTVNNLGCILKYSLINEGENFPVSLAVAAGGGSFSSKTTFTHPVYGPQESVANGSQFGGGLVVSKLIIPFVPYAAAQYSQTGGDTKFSEIDLTLGTLIGLSRSTYIFVEYNNLSITPDGGPIYNSSQIAASFSYGLPSPTAPAPAAVTEEMVTPEAIIQAASIEALSLQIEALTLANTKLMEETQTLTEENKSLKAENIKHKDLIRKLYSKLTKKPAPKKIIKKFKPKKVIKKTKAKKPVPKKVSKQIKNPKAKKAKKTK